MPSGTLISYIDLASKQRCKFCRLKQVVGRLLLLLLLLLLAGAVIIIIWLLVFGQKSAKFCGSLTQQSNRRAHEEEEEEEEARQARVYPQLLFEIVVFCGGRLFFGLSLLA